MNQLHPVFQAALAPFMRGHPAPVSAPNYTAPICPPGQFEHVATNVLMDSDVVCHLEYEAAEIETRTEPGYPACVTLCAAYVRDVNVYDLLDAGMIECIEAASLASLESRAEEDSAESAYEAEISRREYLEA